MEMETTYLNTNTVCASFNHRKKIKSGPIRLIPRKLAANLVFELRLYSFIVVRYQCAKKALMLPSFWLSSRVTNLAFLKPCFEILIRQNLFGFFGGKACFFGEDRLATLLWSCSFNRPQSRPNRPPLDPPLFATYSTFRHPSSKVAHLQIKKFHHSADFSTKSLRKFGSSVLPLELSLI